MPYLYNDFVRKIADGFERQLSAIEAIHGFEYGNEFEIAICKTLRRVLPQRFGICRGYVVNEAGQKAGDDIIIYEQLRYPTFRQKRNYSRKEQVPIEAVFAYIEAKHTLQLTGTGKSSFQYATKQVKQVKALCNQRKAVPLDQVDQYLSLGKGFQVSAPNWPNKRNPVFTAIFARQVRLKAKGKVLQDPEAIRVGMAQSGVAMADYPDLIVAGHSNLALPAKKISRDKHIIIPFASEKAPYKFMIDKVPQIAFGIALAHLCGALNFIELGRMPWDRIVSDGLGLDLSE